MTKEEEQKIVDVLTLNNVIMAKKDFRDNNLKNMMIGHEMANKLVLDKINNGESLEEVKKYLEIATSTKGKNAMKRVLTKDK